MNQNYSNLGPAENTSPALRHRKERMFHEKIEQFGAYERIVPFDRKNFRKEHSSFADDDEVDIIDLSGTDDDDDDQTSGNVKKMTPLNVDSNCRITSRQPSAGNFSKTDSCITQFCEGNVNFSEVSGKKKSGSSTDSEDIEMSDEEKFVPNFLSIKCIDLNSFIAVTSKLPSREEMKHISVDSKTSEGSSTDVEVVYSDDNDTTVLTVPFSKLGNKEKNKNVDKIPVTAALKKISPHLYMPFNEKMPKLTFSEDSSDGQEDIDDEVFLSSDSSTPFEQKVSDRSFLHKMQCFSDTSFKEAFHGNSVLVQNTFDTSNLDSFKCEMSENSTDSETLSDEENPSLEINRDKIRSVRYKSANFVVNNASNDLTDEEELFIEGANTHPKQHEVLPKEEWTETDESGSVRQVTQITTETSIKLGGEEEEKMGGEDVSHTTTTTTRIVTTVTTQDGEQQEQAATEESGDELRHSMEVILNQFMSEDPSSTPKEQPQ